MSASLSDLTNFETAVMVWLLDGQHPALDYLRRQLASARVAERRLTGVGFFTRFLLPPDAPRAPVTASSIRFGDVSAEIEGLQHGAGFLLFIDGGLITMLEGYTFDEPWPKDVERFALSYVGPREKELAKLGSGGPPSGAAD